MEKNLGHIESCLQGMYDDKPDPAFTEDKLINLEDRSRQNNLRIDGIKVQIKHGKIVKGS